jgi:hypothetical protein
MGMSNQPVYRTRNHAYSCRCGRCPQSRPGDWGLIGPLILIFFVVALVGFWPVMIVHGQTDTGGWRWDIHSTYAELAYAGGVGFVALMIWLGNRPAKTRVAAPVTPERLRPPPPSVVTRPVCLHFRAVKVDSVSDRTLIYRCWCPDCDTALPAAFRFSCCGTEPGNGTMPARHMYNCPMRER